MGWLVGIDTGGTFTDLVAFDPASREVYTTKVPSVPAQPGKAVVNALERLTEERGIPLSSVSLLAHGTTVATNAVLERRGAAAGLLITAGHRAVYDMKSD